jgi:hypothetical protein
MRAPITRPSNVAGMLLAGRYWYTDAPGMEPVEVDVTHEHGKAVVRFPPLGEDVGFETLLEDMAAGAHDWQEHFQRIG